MIWFKKARLGLEETAAFLFSSGLHSLAESACAPCLWRQAKNTTCILMDSWVVLLKPGTPPQA